MAACLDRLKKESCDGGHKLEDRRQEVESCLEVKGRKIVGVLVKSSRDWEHSFIPSRLWVSHKFQCTAFKVNRTRQLINFNS
jgi:hypothetical protein